MSDSDEHTMEKSMTNTNQAPEYESSLSGQSLLILFLALPLGILAAVLVLPNWLPGMAASLSGEAPKVFWYLSRATAFVAMGLLWISMMLGVGITNKMARLWPGSPAAFAIHEYVSLLGLGVAFFHGLILIGDAYSNYSLVQLLVPFTAGQYHPFWVGLGQLGFYAWAVLVGSFYVRKGIGQKTWRALHYISFLAYVGALVHGIAAGTDSGLGWVQAFYWLTGGSFLFLFTYRVINSLVEKAQKPLKSPAQQ
jgi:predicted ferric reductase